MSDLKELMVQIEDLIKNFMAGNAPKAKPALKEIDIEDISLDRLLKCSAEELKALCKARGLKVGGKKQDLIDRLRESGGNSAGNKEETKAKPASKSTTKTPSASSSKSKGSQPKVLSTLLTKTAAICIRKNAFGNLEHPPSKLLFNKDKKVYGKQADDGTILSLTDEDLEECKRFKFEFEVPKNLESDVLSDDSENDLEEEKSTKKPAGKPEKKSSGKTEKVPEKKPAPAPMKDKVDTLLENSDAEEEILDPEDVSEVESEEELVEDE